jgi:hypothetical protein
LHHDGGPTRLSVYSKMLTYCQERPLEAACYASFVFLSEDVIAVPRQKPFAIELYKLPSTWNVPPLPGSDPAALDVTRTLLLPSPARSVWVTRQS